MHFSCACVRPYRDPDCQHPQPSCSTPGGWTEADDTSVKGKLIQVINSIRTIARCESPPRPRLGRARRYCDACARQPHRPSRPSSPDPLILINGLYIVYLLLVG